MSQHLSNQSSTTSYAADQQQLAQRLRSHNVERSTGRTNRARRGATRQQLFTLKLALTTGTILATILGTELIATKEGVASSADLPSSATIVIPQSAGSATAAPAAPLPFLLEPSTNGINNDRGSQSNSNFLNQVPTLHSVPRQTFRPLTRSRSSR